ncbi:hypothetical protein GGS26DRAFT_595545 [Hypomontagnella submonticulosa]|nr:hypothetical protein GGS26DRAFT_595545 [Hypomontagnella submonticulosa]
MCRRLFFHTPCSTPGCGTILGSKHRNCYCREALDNRKFGRCHQGIESFPPTLFRDSTAKCTTCRAAATMRTRRQTNMQSSQARSSTGTAAGGTPGSTTSTPSGTSGPTRGTPASTSSSQWTAVSTHHEQSATPQAQQQASSGDDSQDEGQAHAGKKRKRSPTILESFEQSVNDIEEGMMNALAAGNVTNAEENESEEESLFVVASPPSNPRGRARGRARASRAARGGRARSTRSRSRARGRGGRGGRGGQSQSPTPASASPTSDERNPYGFPSTVDRGGYQADDDDDAEELQPNNEGLIFLRENVRVFKSQLVYKLS